MADLGIVIVSYNVSPLLRDCLRSVYASPEVDYRVYVVDNCSADDSVMMVKAEFPQALLIESPINGGYAYANNLGLRALGFDSHDDGTSAYPRAPRYALLLNPDTYLPPDALHRMVAYLDEHPEVGIAGPKLVRADGSLDLACRRSFPTPEVSLYRMLGLSSLFPKSRRFGRYNLTYLDPDQEASVDSVCGAFMMIRRETIEQVGLLDESFFMYGEDLDWALRIKRLGWQGRYYPGVTILHYKGASSRQETTKTTIEFYRAMLIFYRKHYAQDTWIPIHWLILGAIYMRGGYAHLRNALLPKAMRRVS